MGSSANLTIAHATMQMISQRTVSSGIIIATTPAPALMIPSSICAQDPPCPSLDLNPITRLAMPSSSAYVANKRTGR